MSSRSQQLSLYAFCSEFGVCCADYGWTRCSQQESGSKSRRGNDTHARTHRHRHTHIIHFLLFDFCLVFVRKLTVLMLFMFYFLVRLLMSVDPSRNTFPVVVTVIELHLLFYIVVVFMCGFVSLPYHAHLLSLSHSHSLLAHTHTHVRHTHTLRLRRAWPL